MIFLFNFFIFNDICLFINFFIYLEGGKEIKLIFLYIIIYFIFIVFLVIIEYFINIIFILL